MKTAHFTLPALAAVALALFVTSLPAQQKAEPGTDIKQAGNKEDKKIAPYYPTPNSIVEKMLDLGGLKAGEKVYDLGSGDGRFVIIAARKYKANAYGVELDESLVKQSSDRIRTLGLSPTAHIIQGDLLEQDYSSADLLTIYLLPVAIEKVTPILEKQLKKGARVVVHDFEFYRWKPEKTVDIDDDGEGRSHRLFLYKR
jgi:protein-L-isoaspartate O-methyltransferase